MKKGLRSTGVAVGVLGLVLGTMAANPAMASPDDELIWEEGTVTSISDGDTLVATMDAGSGARGSQIVRTIGVQAPEVSPDECGASQAKDRLRAQLPVGSRVQTRSVDVRSSDAYSGGRIVRSLYAQDEEGNWYDTSRGTMSDGVMMWFPLAADSSNKPEWAHNLEYRVLADDAAGQGRGLWSANLCGGSPYAGMDLRVWAKYYDTEKVYVENRSGFASISAVGRSATRRSTTARSRLAWSSRRVRSERSTASPSDLNNLPADNAAFEGDAVYLMDNAGPYGTGNLRAWFPYPCNPDNCGDVLSGAITMSHSRARWDARAQAEQPRLGGRDGEHDGRGTATVTWAHPNDLGGPSVTYKVSATSSDGGSPSDAAVADRHDPHVHHPHARQVVPVLREGGLWLTRPVRIGPRADERRRDPCGGTRCPHQRDR